MVIQTSPAPVSVFCAVGTGLGVVVNGGGCHVHQQCGKGDTVRVAAPGTNDVRDQPNAQAENKPSLGGRCATDRDR